MLITSLTTNKITFCFHKFSYIQNGVRPYHLKKHVAGLKYNYDSYLISVYACETTIWNIYVCKLNIFENLGRQGLSTSTITNMSRNANSTLNSGIKNKHLIVLYVVTKTRPYARAHTHTHKRHWKCHNRYVLICLHCSSNCMIDFSVFQFTLTSLRH